jgi:hypothetical protein
MLAFELEFAISNIQLMKRICFSFHHFLLRAKYDIGE